MYYDWTDFVGFGLIGALFLALVGLLLAGAIDVTQSIRAREARAACWQRNMDAMRVDFSARVICRSRQFGADTVVVK